MLGFSESELKVNDDPHTVKHTAFQHITSRWQQIRSSQANVNNCMNHGKANAVYTILLLQVEFHLVN